MSGSFPGYPENSCWDRRGGSLRSQKNGAVTSQIRITKSEESASHHLKKAYIEHKLTGNGLRSQFGAFLKFSFFDHFLTFLDHIGTNIQYVQARLEKTNESMMNAIKNDWGRVRRIPLHLRI